jgi:hypothetical protein
MSWNRDFPESKRELKIKLTGRFTKMLMDKGEDVSKAVVCVAESESQVEAIVSSLRTGGFSHNDISVIEVCELFPEMETKPRWRKTQMAED